MIPYSLYKRNELAPVIPRSNQQKVVAVGDIHAATIATEGEGLWIPKLTVGGFSKLNGGAWVCFTGVKKSHQDTIREGIVKPLVGGTLTKAKVRTS